MRKHGGWVSKYGKGCSLTLPDPLVALLMILKNYMILAYKNNVKSIDNVNRNYSEGLGIKPKLLSYLTECAQPLHYPFSDCNSQTNNKTEEIFCFYIFYNCSFQYILNNTTFYIVLYSNKDT